MEKAQWLQRHFAKKTYRTELERIPQYNGEFKRPASHLPGLNKYPPDRNSRSHAAYDVQIDKKLKRVIKKHNSKSSQHITENPQTMKLTFMKPDKLPKLVPPVTPYDSKHGLSQILNNRNNYISGYFESIKATREVQRNREHLVRHFDLIRINEWTIEGSLHGSLFELRATNKDREIVKRYPYEKVAHKIQQNYEQWLKTKFKDVI